MTEKTRPATLSCFDICFALFVALLFGNVVRRWHTAVAMQKDGGGLDAYAELLTFVVAGIALAILAIAWLFAPRRRSRIASLSIISLMILLSYAGITNFQHDQYVYGWLFISAVTQITLQIAIIVTLIMPATIRWHWTRQNALADIEGIFS